MDTTQTDTVFTDLSNSERAELQSEWFSHGRTAAEQGKRLSDWPRPLVKYGVEWYARKAAWQAGWKYYHNQIDDAEAEPYTKPLGLGPSKDAFISNGLFQTVRLAPISKRALVDMFSSRQRNRVKRKIQEMIDKGIFEQIGKGRRGQPVLIQLAPIKLPDPPTPQPNEELTF